MVTACWSVKGGSGTTVVAAALALRLARAAPTLLADLAGDAPAVLGCPDQNGPGVADWLAAGPEVAPDAFERLGIGVADGLDLLVAGSPANRAGATAADGERLVAALDAAAQWNATIVDCGLISDDVARGVAASAPRSLLVVRPCYLALRRAIGAPIRASAVVVVAEPDRSLRPEDVEDVLGLPVITVPWHPAVARAVDAGLLAARLPRQLDALRGAA